MTFPPTRLFRPPSAACAVHLLSLTAIAGLSTTAIAPTLPAGSPESGQLHRESNTVNPETIEMLLMGLGSESFQTRTRSATQLLDIASRDEESMKHILGRLGDVEFPPQDLEIYLAKKRLRSELESKIAEAQLDRFLHDASFDRSRVLGWDAFRAQAGDSQDSRLVFVSAAKRHPQNMQMLADADARKSSDERGVRLTSVDRLDRHDSIGWSLLLCSACQQGANLSAEDAMRLNAILRNAGTGPTPDRDHEQRVISTLVARYLTTVSIDERDSLVIGLRFGCDASVESDCRAILDDPSESPSKIVLSLLAASAANFSAAEIDHWIDAYQNDSRVSHVWRSMMPPKATHRTQVRDVALALQLHRSGIDPRTRGFAALVADPLLVFRPYSLGFESEAKRRAAHARQD